MLGEFALVSVERARVEQLAEAGDRRARRVLSSLQRLSFELSGAQLGITLASVVLGFVSEPVIVELLNRIRGVELDPGSGASVVIALTLSTVVTMVFGELVPKSVAIARPLAVAKLVVFPLRWFSTLFRPLIGVLNALANVLVRALGIEPREELASARSLEEMEILIRSSVERGALDPATLPLLSRTIAFSEKDAGEVLVPRVALVALPVSATIEELAETARSSGHSRILVHHEGATVDSVVGTVHVKDVYRVPREDWATATLAALVEEVPVVPESRDLEPLLTELTRTGRSLAVVVDEYGGTAGIVTVEDVLEEIVGEIEDEYDRAPPAAVSWAGVHVVSGMLHEGELAEQTGFEMPEGDFETLAGFLLDRLGEIPVAGDRVEEGGWVFEVAAMDGHRVDRVRISPPRAGGDGDAP